MTDLYEWGWGQSFHFSPRLPGKDWAASEAAHEARLPALLGLGPGTTCLDVGCGVGGPMRTIASTSGAEVTGLTINGYQVQRAHHHNAAARCPPPPPVQAWTPDAQGLDSHVKHRLARKRGQYIQL